MQRWALIAISWYDRALFRAFVVRHRRGLTCADGVSPALRLARLRVEPGGRVELGPGCTSERRRGVHVWVQCDGRLEIGERTWLRTEYGPSYFTVFPGARISIGARALINSAMFHSKCEITTGEDCLFGFGTRVLDADLHPLDSRTPERTAPVRIGNRVWLGSDVTVLRGVTIGDDTVVGARSVVTRDLPARVLAVGCPARPVRELARRA
jgi:carbonic anhydrase/acetyltransferase-like protein (isoleucine patch superfamily)